MAKPMKTLELHYPMVQFLIMIDMKYWYWFSCHWFHFNCWARVLREFLSQEQHFSMLLGTVSLFLTFFGNKIYYLIHVTCDLGGMNG